MSIIVLNNTVTELEAIGNRSTHGTVLTELRKVCVFNKLITATK